MSSTRSQPSSRAVLRAILVFACSLGLSIPGTSNAAGDHPSKKSSSSRAGTGGAKNVSGHVSAKAIVAWWNSGVSRKAILRKVHKAHWKMNEDDRILLARRAVDPKLIKALAKKAKPKNEPDDFDALSTPKRKKKSKLAQNGARPPLSTEGVLTRQSGTTTPFAGSHLTRKPIKPQDDDDGTAQEDDSVAGVAPEQ